MTLIYAQITVAAASDAVTTIQTITASGGMLYKMADLWAMEAWLKRVIWFWSDDDDHNVLCAHGI